MNDELAQTEFGWAVKSEMPPHARDLFWLTPLGHIYTWDGDGWVRIKPPELILKEPQHG